MSIEDWKKSENEQRAKLKAQRDADPDPIMRAAYALAERAGFDWYDTESAARRMAEHAGMELVEVKKALRAILLYHSAPPWTGDKQREWSELTGTEEATSRNLCVVVRSALNQIVGAP